MFFILAPSPPNNTPGAFPDHSGPSPAKSGKPTPNPARPDWIPKYFGPFLAPRGQTHPSSSSGSRFPAGGAGQNSIWSHEAANQTQNHDFGRSRFWPISVEVEAVGVEAVGVEAVGVKAVGVKSHVLRGWRSFFFPEKCTSWKKVTCSLGIFCRFWVDFDPKMTQNVPGPECSL